MNIFGYAALLYRIKILIIYWFTNVKPKFIALLYFLIFALLDSATLLQRENKCWDQLVVADSSSSNSYFSKIFESSHITLPVELVQISLYVAFTCMGM